MNFKNRENEELIDEYYFLKVGVSGTNSRELDATGKFVKTIQSTGVLAQFEQEGEKFPQYAYAIIACLGALLIGGSSAWTSPALPLFYSTNSSAPFMLHSGEEGDLVVAFLPFGAILGTLPAGVFADFFGRKKTMLIISVPFIASWFMTSFATNVLMLYVARFIAGFVFGMYCGVLPMYINEISEISVRGTLGSLFEFFVIVGQLVVFSLGISKSYSNLCYTMTALTIVSFLSLTIIPESPTYLVKKQKYNKAEKSLRRLRGSHYDVSVELNDIRLYLQNLERPTIALSTVYNQVKIKALIICCGLMIFQQLSGISGVIYYAETIFKNAGAQDPSLYSIIMSVAQVVATLVAVFLVDRAGRKILLYISSAMSGLCMVALGYYFWRLENKMDISDISWVPLCLLGIYIIGFSLGLGPISWLTTVEVLDPEIKSFGATLSAATNLIFHTLVAFFFRPMTELINTSHTFWLFAIFCGLSILFVWIILPETKGKSIQEVQIMLAKRKIKLVNR